jgi:AcrR family transcriptional regulator
MIFEAAHRMLKRAPHEPLTIARIAGEVDAVPAALYRHFASVDELLDGVLGRVLGSVRVEIRGRASWAEQVRDWMISVRTHLLRYPAVVPLIGRHGRTSPAWLEVASVLVAILERTGLSGARLARAHLWIIETTIAMVIQEVSMSLPDQISGARASLMEMSGEGRARLAPIIPHLARIDADAFFAFVTDRTVGALVALVEGR